MCQLDFESLNDYNSHVVQQHFGGNFLTVSLPSYGLDAGHVNACRRGTSGRASTQKGEGKGKRRRSERPTQAHASAHSQDDSAARPVVETSACSHTIHTPGGQRIGSDQGNGSSWQEILRGMQETRERSQPVLSIPTHFCSNDYVLEHNGDQFRATQECHHAHQGAHQQRGWQGVDHGEHQQMQDQGGEKKRGRISEDSDVSAVLATWTTSSPSHSRSPTKLLCSSLAERRSTSWRSTEASSSTSQTTASMTAASTDGHQQSAESEFEGQLSASSKSSPTNVQRCKATTKSCEPHTRDSHNLLSSCS